MDATFNTAETTQRCRCCGQPMTVAGVQTYPEQYNRPPIVMIECRVRECKMYKMTLDQREYATQDLSAYLK